MFWKKEEKEKDYNITIHISVPKGSASKIEPMLANLILGSGLKVHNHITTYNKENNLIIWQVKAPLRKIIKIARNVSQYETVIKAIFENKLMKKAIDGFKLLDEKGKAELKVMLLNNTKIKIIR